MRVTGQLQVMHRFFRMELSPMISIYVLTSAFHFPPESCATRAARVRNVYACGKQTSIVRAWRSPKIRPPDGLKHIDKTDDTLWNSYFIR